MSLSLAPLTLGQFDRLVDCSVCAGTGTSTGARCTACRGDGRVFDGLTLEVVRALARLAPAGVDFLRFQDERGQWREVLRSGDIVEPRRIQVLRPTADDDGTMDIDEFLAGASSTSWPVGGDDERWPHLPELLLPRHEARWDAGQVTADPVIARVAALRMRGFIGDLDDEIDAWESRCGDLGRSVLEGALVQHIVMTFS